MAAQIISGKTLAAQVKQQVAEEVARLKGQGITPCLAVMLVGNDPASEVYVRGKQNDCHECGIESRLVRMDESASQAEVLEQLGLLANDPSVHGVLVQLPLPAHIDEQAVIAAIPPEKDVDGFTPVNVGRLTIGQQCFLPCTPAGCIEMLKAAGVAMEGKRAVVVGRSNIVGKPAALLLLRENATVTVCHSRTKDLAKICAEADILVAAIGKAKFITGGMVKPGAAVIDVGINRGADGRLCGDVDFEAAAEKAAFITPVPGGVGLMTRAMLLCNTVQAARMAAGR